MTNSKGFKAKKKPTKKVIESENKTLKDQLESMHAFVGQEMLKVMNQVKNLSGELQACVNLLRKDEISKDSIVEKGDTVMIDYAGIFKDTKEVFPGGFSTGVLCTLGAQKFVKGFEEGIEGMKVGSKFKVPVTFPENYMQDLSGKEVEFDIQIVKAWKPSKNDLDILNLQVERLKAQKDEPKQAQQQ
jgi:FKBP-type peptidyl-prolyl cis-trans isomerase